MGYSIVVREFYFAAASLATYVFEYSPSLRAFGHATNMEGEGNEGGLLKLSSWDEPRAAKV